MSQSPVIIRPKPTTTANPLRVVEVQPAQIPPPDAFRQHPFRHKPPTKLYIIRVGWLPSCAAFESETAWRLHIHTIPGRVVSMGRFSFFVFSRQVVSGDSPTNEIDRSLCQRYLSPTTETWLVRCICHAQVYMLPPPFARETSVWDASWTQQIK